MWIDKDTVCFHPSDMRFVKKFGIKEATEMVLDYRSLNKTPFIYDFYQLASFFGSDITTVRKISEDTSQYYHHYEIPKKRGGVREIDEPYAQLAKMQSKIYRDILKRLKCSPYATAYHKGARLSDNAAPHVGNRYLLKMDITDFFGSIRFDTVMSTVFNSSRYPKHIGAVLTSLCCLNDVLPQGACTSPAVSNLVMKHFDDTFGAWCKRRRFNYTRYSDDITVSGNTSLYPAYCAAKDMLGKMGFTLNESKTHFVTNASRQTVTGLTVNEKVSVNADYKRKLRQELYYIGKYGFADVMRRQQMKEYITEQNPRIGYERYYQNLMGRLNYILSVEPNNAYFIDAKENLHEQRFEVI